MNIVRFNLNFKFNRKLNQTGLTIGNFDSLHIGHRELITKVVKVSANENYEPTLVTFYPHPKSFFLDKKKSSTITFRQRIAFLKEYGVKNLVFIRFNKELSNLSPNAFVSKILSDKLNANYIIVGSEFRFAKNRSGSVKDIENFFLKKNIKVESLKEVFAGNQIISSSRCQKLLYDSNFITLNKLLGREYSLAGKVIHGDKIGTKLGFPTLNINIKNLNLPFEGVFAVKIKWKRRFFFGAASLGTRPTINEKLKLALEVFVFDFNKNIYSDFVEVYFLKKIRNQEKFTNLESMIFQMKTDIKKIKDFLKENNFNG
jgi:riboflavin kinase/FMN adenylyltransferase